MTETFFRCLFHRSCPPGTTGDLLNLSGDSTPVKGNTPPIDAMHRLDLGGGDVNGRATTNGTKSKPPSQLLIDTLLQFMCAANRHFCVPLDRAATELSTPVIEALIGNELIIPNLIERLLQMFNRGGRFLAT